jgi:hypothetical protein
MGKVVGHQQRRLIPTMDQTFPSHPSPALQAQRRPPAARPGELIHGGPTGIASSPRARNCAGSAVIRSPARSRSRTRLVTSEMPREREPLDAANGDSGLNACRQLIAGNCWSDSHRSPLAACPASSSVATSKRGGRSLCRPRRLKRTIYFRLVIAVRSAESLAIPAAPHQLEPAPIGLIGVTLVLPPAVKSLVKALQSPFDRLVSE